MKSAQIIPVSPKSNDRFSYKRYTEKTDTEAEVMRGNHKPKMPATVEAGRGKETKPPLGPL